MTLKISFLTHQDAGWSRENLFPQGPVRIPHILVWIENVFPYCPLQTTCPTTPHTGVGGSDSKFYQCPDCQPEVYERTSGIHLSKLKSRTYLLLQDPPHNTPSIAKVNSVDNPPKRSTAMTLNQNRSHVGLRPPGSAVRFIVEPLGRS